MIIIEAIIFLILATGLFITLVVYQIRIMEWVGNRLEGRPEILFLIAAICFIIAGLIAKTIR